MTGYVLIKRDLFWKPNRAGYTGVLAEAGRYPEAGGKVAGYPIMDSYNAKHATLEVYAIRVDRAPDYTEACWPEVRARAEAEAEADMREMAEDDRAHARRDMERD